MDVQVDAAKAGLTAWGFSESEMRIFKEDNLTDFNEAEFASILRD